MNTVFLYLTNLLFTFMPLTRWFRLRALLLKISGVRCSASARIISSARIVFTNVTIGNDTFIGHQVLITGNDKFKVMIGNNVDLAPRVCILSGSHIVDMENPHSAGAGTGGIIIIEDGVWIGGNSTILPGVTIGKKAIIGAGSVVNKDIPAFCIAVGNPCKPIKRWNDELKRFDPM